MRHMNVHTLSVAMLLISHITTQNKHQKTFLSYLFHKSSNLGSLPESTADPQEEHMKSEHFLRVKCEKCDEEMDRVTEVSGDVRRSQ